MSQFAFLQTEWPDVFEAASKAESLALPDPRTACFYARRSLELGVFWLYKSDAALKLPYQEHLSALIRAVRHYYYLLFASRHPTGLQFWLDCCTYEPDGQKGLL